jgi:hypothetical protein
MYTANHLPGVSPEFEADDIDWALGELLHLIWRGKSAGVMAHEYNPLLFYRCIQVIGMQPFAVRQKCKKIIDGTQPHLVRTHFK